MSIHSTSNGIHAKQYTLTTVREASVSSKKTEEEMKACVYPKKQLSFKNTQVAYANFRWAVKQYHNLDDTIIARIYHQIVAFRFAWLNMIRISKVEYLFLPSNKERPRSILCTKDNQLFVLFNKKAQKDLQVDKGTYKKVKLAFNVDTGKWFSSASMTDKEDFEQELKNHELVKDLPEFLPISYHFSYKSKKGEKATKYRILKPFYQWSLHKFINETQVISSMNLEKIISQIFQGIISLHKKNVLFRDTTSKNILINKQFEVKFTDFGSVCRETDEVNRRDMVTNPWWGSPEYAAAYVAYEACAAQINEGENEKTEFATTVINQNILKQRDIVKKVNVKPLDMWSLGCVIYELLFGKLPEWCVKPADDNLNYTKILPLMHQVFESIAKQADADPCLGNKKSIENVLWMLLRFQPKDRMTPEQLEAAMKAGIVYPNIDRTRKK